MQVTNVTFTAVRQGDLETGSGFLAKEFKVGTSEAELRRYFEQSSLDEFAEASWQSRSINGERGDLEGSMTTSTGGVIG